MSRIAPLVPPYEAEIQGQFERIMRGAPPLMLFRVMASDTRAWDKFRAGSLLDRGPLTLREREIVIDRTCALAGCEYEWGVHVAIFAQAAHLTDAQISATVREGADAPCWSAAEQALIAAVDALHARATLTDDEFRRCRHITTMRRSWRSSSSAAVTGPCLISPTGFGCRLRTTRRVFRSDCRLTPRRRAGCRADGRCRPACSLRSRSAR